MKLRTAVLILFSLFLYVSGNAQDTATHAVKVSKHKVKHSVSNVKDSTKAGSNKSEHHTNDSVKLHRTYVSAPPKYARDGYVAINYGFGLPSGDYKSTGNATNGQILSLSAAFPGIFSHCGIAFKFDAGTNGIDQTGLAGELNSQNTYPNIHYSVLGVWGKYSYKTVLTGIYLTYPSKHFTIDGRILIGAMFANIPALSVNYYDSSTKNRGTYQQAISSGSAFAMDFGIEARYEVKPKISILFSIDYLHAVPTFNFITTGAGLNILGNIVQETGRQASSDQAFDLDTFTLGVGYTISAQKHSVPKEN
ncbi:MAG TPA: hypothetical protein VK808_00130 [Bacteroidia bacterium]|nr:hypothetical protein [Bacteroidia bacterium]